MKKLILVLSAILFMTDANTASVVSRSGRAWAAAAGIAAAGNAIDGAIQAGSSAESVRRETVGSGQSDSWNYKETVTTNFDMETLSCRKCVRTQNCTRAQEPMFGKSFCKTWGDPVETCSTIQF